MKPTFSIEFKMQGITYKDIHIDNLTITPALSVEIAENEIETLVQKFAQQGDAWRQAFEDATKVFQTASSAAEQATRGRQASTPTPKKKGKKKKVTSFKPAAADPEPAPTPTTTEEAFEPVEE